MEHFKSQGSDADENLNKEHQRCSILNFQRFIGVINDKNNSFESKNIIQNKLTIYTPFIMNIQIHVIYLYTKFIFYIKIYLLGHQYVLKHTWFFWSSVCNVGIFLLAKVYIPGVFRIY